MVRAGNGVVYRVAQRIAVIGGKRPAQVVVPIAAAVAALGNQVGNGLNVSDNGYGHDKTTTP